jgi:hypothetical protein
MMSWIPLKVIRRFGGKLAICFMSVSILAYSSTLRWRWHVPPKRRLTFNGVRGVMSQKIEVFITTAVKTSNLTSANVDYGIRVCWYAKKWTHNEGLVCVCEINKEETYNDWLSSNRAVQPPYFMLPSGIKVVEGFCQILKIECNTECYHQSAICLT